MTIDDYLLEIKNLGVEFSVHEGLIRDWDSPTPRSPLVHLARAMGCAPFVSKHPAISQIHRATGLSKLEILQIFAAEDCYSPNSRLREEIIAALGLQN